MKLHLIPTPIGDDIESSHIDHNRSIINTLDYFVVENIRTARRYLARLKLDIRIDDMLFVELNEHTPPEQVAQMIEPILAGRACGILSEAGLPCVADPGSLLVAEAHRAGIEVLPMVGASSLMLALMASGANGQSFAFNGYLPVKNPERSKTLRHFERRAQSERQSQIFIETPYRNDSLLAECLSTLSGGTSLTVAVDLTQPTQFIRTKTVAQWKKSGAPVIGKRPAIFILA